MLRNVVQKRAGFPSSGKTQRGIDRFRVDCFPPRTLIQHTQRIAHPAFGKSRKQRGGIRRQVQVLLRRDIFQTSGDGGGVQPLEGVALAAGEDGRRNLIQLRGGQNKEQMCRRFLQNLQQRVERRAGEHMHLVDDVNAAVRGGGREHCLVPQLAHVVHAVVAGRVQLHHVHQAALVDAATKAAFAAGVAVLRVFAVDRLCQNAGAGGLAGSARPDKQISMAEMTGTHLIFQRFGDMGLPDHLVKGARTPFPVERLIHGTHPPFCPGTEKSLQK